MSTGNESDASVEKVEEVQETAPVVVEEQKPAEDEPKKEEPKVEEPKPQRVEEQKTPKKEEFVKPEPVVTENKEEKDSNKEKEAQDNEDSLNLTIGEEDEKLFNDDVSNY